MLALIIADRADWLPGNRSDDLALYDGKTAMVVGVIDGDTIDIGVPDPLNLTLTTRVRLWGIDCPEMPIFGRPAEPYAAEASEFVEQIALNREVRLMLEPTRLRDKFDRVLAHISLPDGRSVNESLLEAGLARADDRWPHSMIRRYAQVELAAKRRSAGMWAGENVLTKQTTPAP